MVGSTQYIIVAVVLISGCSSQRSPYAGRNPVGYPAFTSETTTSTTVAPAAASTSDELGNRFGNDLPSTPATTTTTQRLPIEALGDRGLIERLNKLPIDKQPFWFINWKALEEHRAKPQTYPQKVNPFIDTMANKNSAQLPSSTFML